MVADEKLGFVEVFLWSEVLKVENRDNRTRGNQTSQIGDSKIGEEFVHGMYSGSAGSPQAGASFNFGGARSSGSIQRSHHCRISSTTADWSFRSMKAMILIRP